MKKFIISIALLFAPLLTIAQDSQEFGEKKESSSKFGAGVIFGEPIGPTVKYYFDSNHAADAGFTYSFLSYFLIYADYLYHFPGTFEKHLKQLKNVAPYIGVGGGIRINTKTPSPGDEKTAAFLRVPFGAEWMPENAPLGVFVELVPGLGIIPDIFLLFQGGIGIRYYF